VLIQIMLDLGLGRGAEHGVPGVDLVIAAGDTCQGAVESVERLHSDCPGGAPNRRCPTTGIDAP
jgi:hypothetical protein